MTEFDKLYLSVDTYCGLCCVEFRRVLFRSDCDDCPYTQWCGGCRSQYPHCSFGTLYEDKRCPNVTCAGGRGVYACKDCPEREACERGFFGRDK